jgi:4-hydroxy-4-methyl-2-oxoglutarate aldolase
MTSTELIAALAALDTSAVSDACDRLGITGQVLGIRPLERHYRICGPAFTARYRPADPVHPGTVGDFIDDVPPGAVVVIDNGGRLDATVWGDLLTTVASSNGVGGTVIDGVCRDSRRATELDYPIFSRSTYMRTGKDRVELAELCGLVSVAAVPVRPGDLVCGDADGVVVLPAERVAEVCAAAREVEDSEDAIRRLLAEGIGLGEARDRLGYHRLQKPAGRHE